MASDRGRRIAAFGAIYLIWGSTYLAIRYAIETIPPFFMIGLRAFVAGALLYAWARLRGSGRPAPGSWLPAAAAGVLLFAGGQALLAFAQTRVASGAAALVIATIPLFMTLLQAARDGVGVLSPRVISGLVLGFAGVGILVEPSSILGGRPLDPVGTALLIAAAISWSFGSLLGHHPRMPSDLSLSSGMTLLSGGVVLLAGSILTGEAAGLDPAAVSARSLASFAYLVVFGSIVGFASYAWLLRVSTLSRVSTYAFVNPVVAVLVGGLVGGEEFASRTALATTLMVAAVGLIISGSPAARRHAAPGAEEPRERARIPGAGQSTEVSRVRVRIPGAALGTEVSPARSHRLAAHSSAASAPVPGEDGAPGAHPGGEALAVDRNPWSARAAQRGSSRHEHATAIPARCLEPKEVS